MLYYLVKYSGPFGFIKPWTAVRDSETFSQQFLTPSILEGIEKKLFPELLPTIGLSGKIIRHRLTYAGISRQQEQTQPRAIDVSKPQKSKENKDIVTVTITRKRSILNRGVMLSPILWLAFMDKKDAERASEQHICLCRNEDILLPRTEIFEVPESEFDSPDSYFNGFELRFGQSPQSFLVGYNRFRKEGELPSEMFGWLHIVGNPIYSQEATYE